MTKPITIDTAAQLDVDIEAAEQTVERLAAENTALNETVMTAAATKDLATVTATLARRQSLPIELSFARQTLRELQIRRAELDFESAVEEQHRFESAAQSANRHYSEAQAARLLAFKDSTRARTKTDRVRAALAKLRGDQDEAVDDLNRRIAS